MYSFVDKPPAMLCAGGRLLLWSMRAWRHAGERGTSPAVALHRSFAEWNLSGALGHFDIVMTLLDKGIPGGIALAPLRHPVISEDEAVLLGMWRDAAVADTLHLQGTLTLMTGATLAVPVSAAMLAMSCALEEAGFGLVGIRLAPILG